MDPFLLSLLLLAAGLAGIVLLVVPYVTRPSAVQANGENQAVAAGGTMSFLLVAGLLYLGNPDHIEAIRPRAVESAVLAAVAAVIWVPVYLVAVKARIRARKGK